MRACVYVCTCGGACVKSYKLQSTPCLMDKNWYLYQNSCDIVMKLNENFVITGHSAHVDTTFFRPVGVEEGYELSLTSFYCGPICNITTGNNAVHVKLNEDISGIAFIPVSYVQNVGELLRAVRDTINNFLADQWKLTERVRLRFSLKNNTWTLTMPNSTLIVSCTAERNNVLTLLDLDDGSYEKLQVVEYDFDRSTKLCFIYCSIIQDSYIDSHQSRLLEIVPISTNANYTFFEPLHLKFRRIAIEAFSSITFELRNSEGTLIEFTEPSLSCSKHNITIAKEHSLLEPIVMCLQIRDTTSQN